MEDIMTDIRRAGAKRPSMLFGTAVLRNRNVSSPFPDFEKRKPKGSRGQRALVHEMDFRGRRRRRVRAEFPGAIIDVARLAGITMNNVSARNRLLNSVTTPWA
jgi:hypothetical protein